MTGSWRKVGPDGWPAGGPSCGRMGDVLSLDSHGGEDIFSNGGDHQMLVKCQPGDHTKAMKIAQSFASTILSHMEDRSR